MKRNYDEVSVVRALNKKRSVHVNSNTKHIIVSKDANDVGNGSWGKIDYLCKVHNYIYSISSQLVNKSFKDNEIKHRKTKIEKREDKLNMAAMSKNAMRKAKIK